MSFLAEILVCANGFRRNLSPRGWNSTRIHGKMFWNPAYYCAVLYLVTICRSEPGCLTVDRCSSPWWRKLNTKSWRVLFKLTTRENRSHPWVLCTAAAEVSTQVMIEQSVALTAFSISAGHRTGTEPVDKHDKSLVSCDTGNLSSTTTWC